MRHLILAFVGFSFFLFTGCGVIKTVAIDTCTNGSYNKVVCPGMLEKALPEAPVKVTSKAVCHSASAFMIKSRHATKILSRSHGRCGEVRKLLNRKVRQIGPGVKCRWMKGQIKCAGFNPIGICLFILTLLVSRRSDRKEWYDFEALGHLDARKMVWAIEDELWKARWIERAIETFITLAAFSMGGLILGAASAFLAQKRYGWGSIFALLLSVLFWGSAMEWILFTVKAGVCFLANTDEGFSLLRRSAHWRWKRQAAKLK